MTMMAVRSASTRRSIWRSAGCTATSSAAIGSSSSSSRGSAASARATATRWAWPPESWAGRRSASSAASDLGQPALRAAARDAAWSAGAARPEGDVLERVEVREQQGSWASRATPRACGGTPACATPGRRRRRAPGRPATARRCRAAAARRSAPAAVDLPAPFGPSTASGLAVGDLEGDVDVHARRTVRGRARRSHGASAPGARTPITTTATTTSTRDSATAASASVSRWR